MWFLASVSLIPFSPRLNVRFPENALFLQADEFALEWENVYTQMFPPQDSESDYMSDNEVFNPFWSWFFENACPLPLKLAIELKPFGLMVCARECRDGYVSVMKVNRNGSRTRDCELDTNSELFSRKLRKRKMKKKRREKIRGR